MDSIDYNIGITNLHILGEKGIVQGFRSQIDGYYDPNLGIPVNWAQISNAQIIVENSADNIQIEPSQGTHFFQNITSFGVGYLTINSNISDSFFNSKFLNDIEPSLKNDYLVHYSFNDELKIRINGRNNKGVIYKPGL